jgi:transcription antitermination factor NusG
VTTPRISESILIGGQMLDWHVVYTRHQHEKTVNRLLEGKGIETLLPLRSTVSQWKDRSKLIELPLFPCYVFFRAGSESWLQVLKIPGVHMMVPGCGGPAIVPPAEIEAVRRLTENCKSVEPYPFLRQGDRVRVKSGALAGVEGFLVRKKNFYRLVVSVEILGKSAATEIDALCVERVSSSIPDRLAAGQTTQQLYQPSVEHADQGRQTQMRSR